jgi:hypothetical protein
VRLFASASRLFIQDVMNEVFGFAIRGNDWSEFLKFLLCMYYYLLSSNTNKSCLVLSELSGEYILSFLGF